ncbi:hypothetical protein ACFHYQ_18560 [Sphaerimonospora cavernae]|uniref:4Fe-4S ferredoxin-type domain-containing protein n=1 Tax=Sphaerimonospora cavernae TaxID=1740611 RepID=A0ABV6U8E4_9ACTN
MPDPDRTSYARVVQHTCDDCMPVSCELCAAGGLRFIRRTDRSRGRPVVRESERLITCRARGLWRDLLLGLAR